MNFNVNYVIEKISINKTNNIFRLIFIKIFSLQMNLFTIEIETNDIKNKNVVNVACQILINEQQKN